MFKRLGAVVVEEEDEGLTEDDCSHHFFLGLFSFYLSISFAKENYFRTTQVNLVAQVVLTVFDRRLTLE